MIKKKEYNHKWMQKLREKYERLEREEEEETPAPAEKKVEGEPIERAKPE